MSDQNGAKHLDTKQLEELLDEAETPIMVDFYADWCGPCKMAAPIIDKLADEFKGQMEIVKVNVDENNTAAQENGVMSIPTVIVFIDGEEVDRQIGFPGEDGYRQLIEKHL
jgi:thioredoxin 1